MKLMYTDTFTIGTDPILIQKGAAPGNGVIPSDFSIREVRLEIASESVTLQTKGIHTASNWVTQDPGDGHAVGPCRGEDTKFFWVKVPSASVVANLFVLGD